MIAFQFLGQFTQGDVPVQMMPKLGGLMMLRGYLEGRYIDRNYMALQGEYRFPIISRWGGVLFYGIGDVMADFDDINFEWKHGFGGGV